MAAAFLIRRRDRIEDSARPPGTCAVDRVRTRRKRTARHRHARRRRATGFDPPCAPEQSGPASRIRMRSDRSDPVGESVHGNPAISFATRGFPRRGPRPVAFRPRLATGVAFAVVPCLSSCVRTTLRPRGAGSEISLTLAALIPAGFGKFQPARQERKLPDRSIFVPSRPTSCSHEGAAADGVRARVRDGIVRSSDSASSRSNAAAVAETNADVTRVPSRDRTTSRPRRTTGHRASSDRRGRPRVSRESACARWRCGRASRRDRGVRGRRRWQGSAPRPSRSRGAAWRASASSSRARSPSS